MRPLTSPQVEARGRNSDVLRRRCSMKAHEFLRFSPSLN